MTLNKFMIPPSSSGADVSLTPQQEVSRMAALPEVQAAEVWFREHKADLLRWQIELASIAAPPFGEAPRSAWLTQRFREIGLDDVHADELGNVFGTHPGEQAECVSVSAHLDTVFPAGTELEIRREGEKLFGPGVSDNAAGVTAMLAIAAALVVGSVRPVQSILFVGNVGEEGEGDLRGMRHIFSQPRWRDAIQCSLVLDGAGVDTIVSEGLGSRRFEVTVRGAGGHSWSDFGVPNPIVALARAIEIFSRTPVSSDPKTTFNIGVIHGGTSVNSIPESVSMRVDVRSASLAEIDRLERALRSALAAAIEGSSPPANGSSRRQIQLSAEVVIIGDRPAAELPADARMLQVVRAVDQHLSLSAQIQRASTDANIPLFLGREAVAIGGGGRGGGAHTLQEWFDAEGREQGLLRILLTTLILAGVGE
jgi:tripeptide aminopeptidase